MHARRRERVRRGDSRRLRQGVRRQRLRDLRPIVHAGDLSRDLGPEFKGEYLDRYVPAAPRDVTPVFHSVGASDPLEAADVRTKIDDGLPNTLEEWIPRDGLIAFKIKLNGGNLDADVERIVRIDRSSLAS